jgi:transcriptional regulator with XRE-family HTH domain
MDDALGFLTEVADEDRSSVAYRQQALVLEIADRVHTRIDQLGISQAELARRMGVSRPMVTKLLTGDSNFQLKTLLRLADALDMELMVDFVLPGVSMPGFLSPRAEADQAERAAVG